MDAEVERNFVDIRRKITALEQVLTDGEDDLRRRRDLRRQMRHMRQFVWIIATAFGLFTTGLAIVAGLVHTSDIDQLEKFKNDLKAELLGNAQGAKLKILTLNHENLEGRTIHVTIAKASPQKNLTDTDTEKAPWKAFFDIVTENDGTGSSGEIWYKFYTDESLNLGTSVTDANIDNRIKYQGFISPSVQTVSAIPGGGFSIENYFHLDIFNKSLPDLTHSHLAMLRVYYGNGQMQEYTFYLEK
jgi:hypothetical protein